MQDIIRPKSLLNSIMRTTLSWLALILRRFKPNSECLGINESKAWRKKVYNNEELEEWIVQHLGDIEI